MVATELKKMPRGRPGKTSVFPFRMQAHYYAIQHYASIALGRPGRPVTTAELTKMFAEFVSEGSKVWYSFKAGASQLGPGRYGGEGDLGDVVEARYPEALPWRDHLLWSALEYVELTERRIHALMWKLPITVRCTLMQSIGDVGVQRYLSRPDFEARTIVEHRSLDALVAAVLLVREAELRQEEDRWQCAKQAMIDLLPTLRANPVTGQVNFAIAPFADDVVDYIMHTFSALWVIIPGFYSGEP